MDQDRGRRTQASAAAASGGATPRRISTGLPNREGLLKLTSEWILTPVTNQSTQKYRASEFKDYKIERK